MRTTNAPTPNNDNVNNSNAHGLRTGTPIVLMPMPLHCNAYVKLVPRVLLLVTSVNVAVRGPDEPALSPWLAGRNHLDDRIHRLQDAMGQAPTEDWPLARAAMQTHVSVRTLTRRFRAATGGSLHDYHSSLRLALAELARAQGAGSEAAAEAAGLGSTRQLRRLHAQYR